MNTPNLNDYNIIAKEKGTFGLTSSNRLCKLRTEAVAATDGFAEDDPLAAAASAWSVAWSFCSSNITCLKKLTGGTYSKHK